MLKIRRKTWHLRLVRFYSADYTPRDLCSYFWAIVGAIFMSAMLILSLPLWPIGVVASRGSNIIEYVGKSSGRKEAFDWSFRRKGTREGIWWAFGFSIVLWLALGLYVFSRVYSWNAWTWGTPALVLGLVAGLMVVIGLLGTPKPYPANPVKTKTIKEIQPNLLVEFIKAKKQRICPLIEVVDV